MKWQPSPVLGDQAARVGGTVETEAGVVNSAKAKAVQMKSDQTICVKCIKPTVKKPTIVPAKSVPGMGIQAIVAHHWKMNENASWITQFLK